MSFLLGEGLIGTRTAPNLHFIADKNGNAQIGVSNPLIGGPVFLCRKEQKEVVLIPDELEKVGREPITILLRQAGRVQYIFLDPI